ncbi:hypothetical protein TNCV_3256671 [Trichonephila clavipes]|nr:hypothetical protein TNCV_3256671 [Trichonephila clavipes]
MPLYSKILERTICLVHLITSDWSGTSAELPHKVRCLLKARENPKTHPNIYECNDPPGRENVMHPLECFSILCQPFATASLLKVAVTSRASGFQSHPRHVQLGKNVDQDVYRYTPEVCDLTLSAWLRASSSCFRSLKERNATDHSKPSPFPWTLYPDSNYRCYVIVCHGTTNPDNHVLTR